MQIKDMMNAAFDKIEKSGAIEKKVEETIQKSLESIINELFRDWSDFGKDLKKKLGEAVKVNLESIDLPKYNVLIENYIKQQTTAIMNEQHQKLIDERLENILKVEEKPEWKLSEIVAKIVDGNEREYGDDDWEKLTLIFDNWYKESWHIYIDPEPNKENYHCAIQLNIDDGKISSARVGEYKTKDFKKEIFLNLHGVEALIFRLYSQGVKIIIDENACEDASYYPDPYN
jgi:hypothetical protein